MRNRDVIEFLGLWSECIYNVTEEMDRSDGCDESKATCEEIKDVLSSFLRIMKPRKEQKWKILQ